MKSLLSNSGCKVRIPFDGPDDMDNIIFVNDLLVERAVILLIFLIPNVKMQEQLRNSEHGAR